MSANVPVGVWEPILKEENIENTPLYHYRHKLTGTEGFHIFVPF
jgi:hypothetical protein